MGIAPNVLNVAIYARRWKKRIIYSSSPEALGENVSLQIPPFKIASSDFPKVLICVPGMEREKRGVGVKKNDNGHLTAEICLAGRFGHSTQ